MKNFEFPSQYLAKVAEDKEPKKIDPLSALATTAGGIGGRYGGVKAGKVIGERLGLYPIFPEPLTPLPYFHSSAAKPFEQSLYAKRTAGVDKSVEPFRAAARKARSHYETLRGRENKINKLLVKYTENAAVEPEWLSRLDKAKKLATTISNKATAARNNYSSAIDDLDRAVSQAKDTKETISERLADTVRNRSLRRYGKIQGRRVGGAVLGGLGALLGGTAMYTLTKPATRKLLAKALDK